MEQKYNNKNSFEKKKTNFMLGAKIRSEEDLKDLLEKKLYLHTNQNIDKIWQQTIKTGRN